VSARVVLRDGRVLTYNGGQMTMMSGDWLEIHTGKQPHDGLIAKIRASSVERFEFSEPCSVRREVKTKRGWREIR
jgi:hypothetical protein